MPRDESKLTIGLEHERMIFHEGRPYAVRGVPQSVLPHDTLSFLAETRGAPASSPFTAVTRFEHEQRRVDSAYARFGLELRYGEWNLTDEEHRFGLELEESKLEEDLKANLVRGSGLHIHFGIGAMGWLSEQLHPIPPLSEAVGRLDSILSGFIKGDSAYRVPGAWKPKPWGWEYRSLLWTGDLDELAFIAGAAYFTVEEFYREFYREFYKL